VVTFGNTGKSRSGNLVNELHKRSQKTLYDTPIMGFSGRPILDPDSVF
jgi:hypothetical protein